MSDMTAHELILRPAPEELETTPQPQLLFNEMMANDVKLLKNALQDIPITDEMELELRFDVIAVPRRVIRKR